MILSFPNVRLTYKINTKNTLSFQSAASDINSWNMKINSSFRLPAGWELQLTSIYYAPDIIPQGKIEDRYSLDFGLKRKFAGNRMEFRLSGTDILNTFQIQKLVQGDGFTLKAYQLLRDPGIHRWTEVSILKIIQTEIPSSDGNPVAVHRTSF